MDGRPAPDRNDEYLLYQTLIGAWPLAPMPDHALADFTARIREYMLKATKEAKVNTSWINPNEAYDEALRAFVSRILEPGPGNRFLADFVPFQRFIARLGMVNSLAQTLIKITAPGVPDLYQGTEVWDFSLVDPDNRRPVDFALRASLLANLRERIAGGDLLNLVRELVDQWPDGRIKLYTTHRALSYRRAAADLFRRGAYIPLPAEGARKVHLCAFARQGDGRTVLTVVPRLTARLADNGTRLPLGRDLWDDTWLVLPRDLETGPCRNLFTGVEAKPFHSEAGTALPVGEILSDFPVALLEASGSR